MGKRFCPALLPTTLLYPESFFKQLVDFDCVMPNRHLEIRAWLAHREAFDARVKEVEVEVTHLSRESCAGAGNREAINMVIEKYQLEHRTLDARILNDILFRSYD